MRLTFARWMDLSACLACILFLLVADYLQYKVGLIPCPLCIIQRSLITLLGILFLMGGVFNLSPVTRGCLHTLSFLLAAIGTVVASRQLWMEHSAGSYLSSCQATLAEYTGSTYLHKVTEVLFQGTSSCSDSHWSFLGLDLPLWTLLFFVLLAVLALRQVYLSRLSHQQKRFF